MWYGGDYNPEQWEPETIEEDIRFMKEMHVLRYIGCLCMAEAGTGRRCISI